MSIYFENQSTFSRIIKILFENKCSMKKANSRTVKPGQTQLRQKIILLAAAMILILLLLAVAGVGNTYRSNEKQGMLNPLIVFSIAGPSAFLVDE